MEYPKIRAIEPLPAEDGSFYLRDPLRVSDSILVVSRAMLFVVSLFDGKRTVVDIQADFARATGEILPRQQVDEIVQALDEALFLDNEKFVRAQAEIVTSFHASDLRGAIHAGLSYPEKPEELASYLGEILSAGAQGSPGGPGGRVSADANGTDLQALVAPHIDLRRGGAAYGAAYRALALRSRARRFVVFGISHHPTVHPFALTRKDYDTPLGPVATDRDFVDRLAADCTTDFLADEIAHRNEHSVEFQLLFLQYLLGGHSELAERRPFTVVPILCSSAEGFPLGATGPAGAGEAAEFLGTLGRMLSGGGEECLIAAVDFAHLGRQFGQDVEVTDELVREAEQEDRRMMDLMTSRDAEGFLRLIREEKDRRNVCGVPAIYAVLRLLGPGGPGRLLHYGQAVDRTTHSVVTFAGMEFPRSPR